MGAEEKSEEELIGTLVKLRTRDRECEARIEKLLEYHGAFYKAIEKTYGERRDPEYTFKAKMSVKPDEIIRLAEELRSLQKEYENAHKELRDFERRNPSIANKW